MKKAILFLSLLIPVWSWGKAILHTRIPKKISICGVCKNVDEAIPYVIQSMETLGNCFEDYAIFIYENNSKDNTPKLLTQWAKKNKRVHLTSENLTGPMMVIGSCNINREGMPCREELIARARNIVLKEVMSKTYDDYAYVLWMDMDFKHLIPIEAILETVQSDKEWDVVSANGITHIDGDYYDAYALRDDFEPIGPEMRSDWWTARAPRHFPDCEEWYKVYSAFGGLAIYKRESLKGCRYSGVVTPDTELLMRKIVQTGLAKNSWQIHQYLEESKEYSEIHILGPPKICSPRFNNPNHGYKIHEEDEIVWKIAGMNMKYPVICEHVPLHASMIKKGHDKHFINPKMKMFLYP